jgi:hypothetical protein
MPSRTNEETLLGANLLTRNPHMRVVCVKRALHCLNQALLPSGPLVSVPALSFFLTHINCSPM